MRGSSIMIVLFTLLIAILILNKKTNAVGDSEERQFSGNSAGQKVELKKEEKNYPVVFYYRGCLPTEIPLAINVPCTPENVEEFTKYGADPNIHHEKCPKWRSGIIPTCRYGYSGFVCCVPEKPTYRIDETLIFNKKAAYIMADILLKTSLFLEFGEVINSNTRQYLEAFEQFRGVVVKKINLDKISLPIDTLHSFFKYLSTEIDGIVNEEESDMHNEIGFNKLLGTNMEKELNKLCADYEKTGAQQSHEYDEICKKVDKFIHLQFHNAETVWLLHKTKLEANSENNFDKNVRKLVNAYNKDGNTSYSYQIPNKEKIDLEDARKIVAYGEARNIFRQIWIRALHYALMSIDVCYFPSRIKFWDQKLKKTSKLSHYREGMSNAEYLIYFLLKIIKQIHPKFNNHSIIDDPYQAIERDDVKLINATLPKQLKLKVQRGDLLSSEHSSNIEVLYIIRLSDQENEVNDHSPEIEELIVLPSRRKDGENFCELFNQFDRSKERCKKGQRCSGLNIDFNFFDHYFYSLKNHDLIFFGNILAQLLSEIKGLKILVIAPNRFGSHFALFKAIVRTLLTQEWIHKIKLFIPEVTSKDRKPTDLTTGGKLVVEYFNPNERAGNEPKTPIMSNYWASRDYQNAIYYLSGSKTDLFLDLAEQREKIEELKAENFDIGIAELWDHGAFPILWLLGIKNIFATQNMPLLESIHYEFLGYLDKIKKQGDIPELWTTKFDDHKVENSPDFSNNLQQKVSILNKRYNELLMQPFGKIVKETYGIKKVPSFEDLFNGIRNIFLNTQPFFDFPMPPGYPSKIVHIGGIQLPISAENEKNSLDEMEMRAIERSRGRKGLILISFGTVVSMKDIPETIFDYFLQAFEMHNDYEFLLKYESEDKSHLEMLQKYDNVHLKKWLNQFEILGNAQTKLFVSQCGINSVIESVHHAVPILCIPIIADQFYISEALAKQKAAVVVDKDDMSNFAAKIGLALEDRYKQQIQHLKMKMNAIRPAEKFLEKIRELF